MSIIYADKSTAVERLRMYANANPGAMLCSTIGAPMLFVSDIEEVLRLVAQARIDRSPYIFGVKPANGDAQLAAGRVVQASAAPAEPIRGALHDAVERAAKELPIDYQIEIEIERGYACVRWTRPDMAWQPIEDSDGIEYALTRAIDSACLAATESNKGE